MSISSGQKITASDVNNHVNNKNNPHAVTASQIGAATTAQINTLQASLDKLEGDGEMLSVDLSGYSYFRSYTGSWNSLNGGYEYIIFPYENRLCFGIYVDSYYKSVYDHNPNETSGWTTVAPANPIKITIPSGMNSFAISYGTVFRKAL